MMHSIARVEFRQNAARLCVLLAALSGLVSGGCGPGHSAVLPAPRPLAEPVRKSANTRPFEKSFAPGVSKAALRRRLPASRRFHRCRCPIAQWPGTRRIGFAWTIASAVGDSSGTANASTTAGRGDSCALISLKPQAAPGGGGK